MCLSVIYVRYWAAPIQSAHKSRIHKCIHLLVYTCLPTSLGLWLLATQRVCVGIADDPPASPRSLKCRFDQLSPSQFSSPVLDSLLCVCNRDMLATAISEALHCGVFLLLWTMVRHCIVATIAAFVFHVHLAEKSHRYGDCDRYLRGCIFFSRIPDGGA